MISVRRRLVGLIALIGLVLAACGPASVEISPTIADAPVAPDFTLELGEGGTYTLSQGERPVYLVFWAEW